MASRDPLDDPTIALINLPPTPKQKRLAFTAAAVLVAALGAVAPFATTPLPRSDAFIPILNATISVTALITAVLLYAQYSIYRSRAILVLAGGYLFSALIVIPHALTFPGAFTPTGLLGAGPQTTAWLYIFWHLGFPAALLTYALLKDEKPATHAMQTSARFAIGGCIAFTTALVGGLAWLTTAGDQYMPRLFMSATELTLLGRYTPASTMIFSVLVLVLLWIRRRSVLDLWLMVVACSLIGELALTVVRFSLGFYASRIFSLVASTVVLLILLGEITKLYARLAHTNMALRRERNNKLMNLEAVVASIAHEVRQPLTAIVMRSDSAQRALTHTPPDLEKTQAALNNIINDGRHISQTFDNIRDLFRTTDQGRALIDVNEMASGALGIVKDELKKNHITTRTELAADLPKVRCHRGQLQEVLLNLIHNAIETMDSVKDGRRELHLATAKHGSDAIVIAVEDTGPGIDPKKLDTIFEAFVTTKPTGMGLGLAICRTIIERHGGQLLASSDGKHGALFEIVLPIKAAEPTA